MVALAQDLQMVHRVGQAQDPIDQVEDWLDQVQNLVDQVHDWIERRPDHECLPGLVPGSVKQAKEYSQAAPEKMSNHQQSRALDLAEQTEDLKEQVMLPAALGSQRSY